MSSKFKLRLVTYNVRRFTTDPALNFKLKDKCSNTIKDIANALAQRLSNPAPSVLALNEVDIRKFGISGYGNQTDNLSCLDQLSLELSERVEGNPKYSVHFFGHVGEGKYGNALLTNDSVFKSKSTLIGTSNTHLPGGSSIKVPAGTKKFNGEIASEDEVHQIKRGMLGVNLELNLESYLDNFLGSEKFNIQFYVLHLDHISEEERVVQLRGAFNEEINKPTEAQRKEALNENHTLATFLLGDFNALTRSDYNTTEWESGIEEKARKNNWITPVPHGCLRDIVIEENGFIDTFQSSNHDVSTLPSQKKCSAHGMYRIDYIFAKFLPNSSQTLDHTVEITNSQLLSDMDFSDHKPMCSDIVFQLKSVSYPGEKSFGTSSESPSKM